MDGGEFPRDGLLAFYMFSQALSWKTAEPTVVQEMGTEYIGVKWYTMDVG